jgi:hypothetical protein
MPFFDFNSSEFNWPERENLDVCIAGAGAAGILLAVRLYELGVKVLLIESGHFFEDEAKQELNEVEQTGKTLTNSRWGRKRAIGGTTIAWGGQSLPFSDLDFEQRRWVKNSGWPIKLSDLKRFYEDANAFMKIDKMDFEDDIFNLLKLNKLGFDDNKLYQHFSKWAPEPNFRKIYERFLSEKIDLIYNAHLTKITFLNNGEQVELCLNNFEGSKKILRVPKLILATGGIEANRILLSNRQQFCNGIGNHSGWLGKCFMEHPCIEAGVLTNSTSPFNLQKNFNTHLIRKIKYSAKLSLSNEAQISKKILNGSASLLFTLPNEQFNPYTEVKSFLRTKKFRHLANAIKNAENVSFLHSIDAILRHNFFYKDKAVPHVVFMLEQEPLEESSITLSEEVDMFEIPKAKINWSISKLTWDTAIILGSYLKTEFKRLELGDLEISKNLRSDNDEWLSCLFDVNHHMGGTRMSSSKEFGVIDPNCQVWNLPSLFVCSTSVFPTSSFSNPTLTLLALCERLVSNWK